MNHTQDVQPPRKVVPVVSASQRRPFVRPTVEELGALRELTLLGGSL